MHFSVVIPLYNKRPYIARAIRSVLDQSHRDFELIVVDDGSTDGSAKIVEGFVDERLRLLRQANAGEAAARNRGIREAQGTHIAFLDADDEWKRELLQTIRDLVVAHPGAAIYGTGLEVVRPDGRVSLDTDDVRRHLSPHGKLNYPAALSSWCFPLTSTSVCVPAQAFDSVGLFDERMKIGTDIDMWIRLALSGPAYLDPRPLAVYHTEAADRSTAQPSFWQDRLFFADAVRAKLPQLNPTSGARRNIERFLAHTTYETLLAANRSDSGKTLFRQIWSRRRQLGLKYVLRSAGHFLKRMFALSPTIQRD